MRHATTARILPSLTFTRRWGAVCLAAVFLGLLAGCAPLSYRERFDPALAELSWRVEDESGTESEVRALASLVGRTGGGEEPNVNVRLRIFNDAARPVVLETGGVELVTADLEPLAEPADRDPVTIEPGNRRTVTVTFPVPESAVGIEGLNLTVPLRIGAQTVRRSVTFTRPEREYRGGHRWDYQYHRYWIHPYHGRYFDHRHW